MVYLDNSATTIPYPEVLDAYMNAASQYYGNPSSLHDRGADAERLLRQARETIAGTLDVDATELVFTSGGTEGNNLAIKGVAFSRRNLGNHIVTTAIEHPSVLETCRYLETQGFEVTYLPVSKKGNITAEDVQKACKKSTILVSIMHVNHETGVIQPVEEIGRWLQSKEKVRFHVDHVQGAAKVPLKMYENGIDLCTLSAHKFHGLKGTGVLFVRDGVRLEPLLHGGGQERTLRSGTENVPGIAALAKALRLSSQRLKKEAPRMNLLKKDLIQELEKREEVAINTPKEGSAPHIVNVSIPGARPEIIIQALTKQGIDISSKSACASRLQNSSEVLLAQFGEQQRAESGLRFSFSYDTTETDIEKLQLGFDQALSNLKELKEVRS